MGIFFSCTARDEIDEESKRLGRVTRSPKHINKLGMNLYCWVGCLGVMYHAPTVGLIQIPNLKKNNDYAMWLKVIKKCDCYCIDDVLAFYRIRSNSISHDSIKKLIKSHYTLFTVSEGYSPPLAIIMTGVNCFFGVLKKIIFVKKVKDSDC